MGSLSVSTHRGLVHWKGLLLVVSLLNFWSQPSTAQVTVESKDALEGADVRLRILPQVLNAEAFQWYSGRTINSYYHIAYLFISPTGYIRSPSGGEIMVESDGSLLLKNVTVRHSGYYTVVVQLKDCQQMIACGQLHVYPFVSPPTLLVSKTTVTENKDVVVMTCDTNAHAIHWLFEGTDVMFTERMKLSRDRKVLTIDPVQREDAGYYQCRGVNPMTSGKSARLKLDVKFE